MAILSVIAVLLGLGAFLAMSRPFKIFTIAVPVFVGGLLVLGKGDSQLAAWVFSKLLPININPLKYLMTLLSTYIGVVVVGAILGIMRSSAPDEISYKADRKSFLVWLLKWGSVFALFREMLAWIISVLFFDGDTDAGWFLTRAATPHVLVAFLIFLAIVGAIMGKFSAVKEKTASRRAPQ